MTHPKSTTAQNCPLFPVGTQNPKPRPPHSPESHNAVPLHRIQNLANQDLWSEDTEAHTFKQPQTEPDPQDAQLQPPNTRTLNPESIALNPTP